MCFEFVEQQMPLVIDDLLLSMLPRQEGEKLHFINILKPPKTPKLKWEESEFEVWRVKGQKGARE